MGSRYRFSEQHGGEFISIEEKWNYLHRAKIWKPSPLAVIRFILDKGAAVNAQSRYGIILLYYTLRTQNTDAAITLLEAGADPNMPNQDNIIPLPIIGRILHCSDAFRADGKAKVIISG